MKTSYTEYFQRLNFSEENLVLHIRLEPYSYQKNKYIRCIEELFVDFRTSCPNLSHQKPKGVIDYVKVDLKKSTFENMISFKRPWEEVYKKHEDSNQGGVHISPTVKRFWNHVRYAPINLQSKSRNEIEVERKKYYYNYLKEIFAQITIIIVVTIGCWIRIMLK